MPSTEGMKIRSVCSLGALPSLSILRHSLNHLVVDVVVAHAAAQLEPEWKRENYLQVKTQAMSSEIPCSI